MVSAYAIEFGVFQLNLQSRNNLNPNSQGSGFLFYLCKVLCHIGSHGEVAQLVSTRLTENQEIWVRFPSFPL